MFLILGARGPVGRELCQLLQASGLDFFEYDGGDLSAVLRRVDGVYLGLPTRQASEEIPLVEQIARSGVRRVVKISGWRASESCPLDLGRQHAAIERRMRELKIDATILRPNLLMSNLRRLTTRTLPSGQIFSNAGSGRVAWVHPRDVAQVAALSLTDERHAGRTYEVAGPETFDYLDLAARFTRAAGFTVHYTETSETEQRKVLIADGFSGWMLEHLVEMYEVCVRTGFFSPAAESTPGVLSGALTIDEWITENLDFAER